MEKNLWFLKYDKQSFKRKFNKINFNYFISLAKQCDKLEKEDLNINK